MTGEPSDTLKEIKEIKGRLDDIDRQQTNFSDRLFGKEINDAIRTLEELNGLVRGDRKAGTPGLKSVIYGSKELGVKPIRTEMEELNGKVDEILTIFGRVKWLLGILGITSLAGAASLVILLRQLLGV